VKTRKEKEDKKENRGAPTKALASQDKKKPWKPQGEKKQDMGVVLTFECCF
jgi:hypothetical protein